MDPVTIVGYVTLCEGGECVEECENADSIYRQEEVVGDDDNSRPVCDSLPRLGEECSYAYEPVVGTDVLLTIEYTGTERTMSVETMPTMNDVGLGEPPG